MTLLLFSASTALTKFLLCHWACFSAVPDNPLGRPLYLEWNMLIFEKTSRVSEAGLGFWMICTIENFIPMDNFYIFIVNGYNVFDEFDVILLSQPRFSCLKRIPNLTSFVNTFIKLQKKNVHWISFWTNRVPIIRDTFIIICAIELFSEVYSS